MTIALVVVILLAGLLYSQRHQIHLLLSDSHIVGSSDPHRAAIWVYHLDGSGGELFTRGLRNAVGMTINPWNQQIWVTDNGSDYMGREHPA